MSKNRKDNLKKLIYIFFTLALVFLVFSFSLNRDWQYFDEKIIFDEGIFPIPTSFTEALEVILLYAFNYHTDSHNAFFSNIVNIRSDPLGASIYILALYFFQKNFLYYHLVELFIHLTNTILVWLIFYKFLSDHIFSTLFTLVWALHPALSEAVLLGTNWSSLLNYTFCLIFIYYSLKKLRNEKYTNSVSEFIFIPCLVFLSTLISEYSFVLPFILFFIAFSFLKSPLQSFKFCIPYFIGFLFFAFYYLVHFLSLVKVNPLIHQSFNFSIERILWFSPQILFHFLKLFFYPEHLSTYQTNLVHLANSYTEPYALFTSFVFLIFLLVPVLFLKKAGGVVYCFIFSLLPYLHIISPTYCLIADRYCYFPLFGGMLVLISLVKNFKNKKLVAVILVLVLIPLTTRTLVRIKDWNNSHALFSSATNCFKDKLHKGFGYSILGYYYESTKNKKLMKEYMNKSIKELNIAIEELKTKSKNEPNQPQTLKTYGLDTKSLISTAAFCISYTKLYNFNHEPTEVLNFYEPYVKENLDFAGPSQLNLYAKLLLKTNQYKKALNVLKIAKEKYPFSPLIIYTLSNYYLYTAKDLDKAEEIIKEGYYYYPSYRRTLLRLIKLYELKKDNARLAYYEYLIGLRTHSQKAYQKAAQLYMLLNNLKEAKKCFDKLIFLDKENPVTFLLLSKYYSLTGNKDKVFETLNHAYQAANKADAAIDITAYKSILLSLISFNLSYSNNLAASKYINELKQLPDLQKSEKDYADFLKKKYNLQ